MAKKKQISSNSTLERLKGTPFKTAGELKSYQEQIHKDEWQSIERARVRRELLLKEENRKIIAPFLNGFKANFVGADGKHESLVKVFLTEDEAIQVEIDNELRSTDVNGTMEACGWPQHSMLAIISFFNWLYL